MKKTLMLLVAAICLSCSGQWVITNYVYTVSNITIVTQNEITQNVNRAYNYYSTNFTVNVETNLYIDTMIGTNIATNVTTYETNVNTYIDTWQNVYQTNYTTEVTLTNFEGYVEQCETIISNGVDYISSLTNNIGDAMLYAYICNETAQRLASTNAIVFSTNSIPLPDYQGNADRLFQLACNNLNGSFMAKSAGTSGYNIYATSVYSVSWRNAFTNALTIRMNLSHVYQTDHGMEVVYFPSPEYRMLFSCGDRKYLPSRMIWRYDNSSNILEVLEFDSKDKFIHRHEARRLSILYPTAYGMNTSDDQSGTSYWNQMAPSIAISGITLPFYFKTSDNNPHKTEIFAPMFPSLDEWRYMWWIENLTSLRIR